MTWRRLRTLALRASAVGLLVLVFSAPEALRAQPRGPRGGGFGGPRHGGPPNHGPPPHLRGPGGGRTERLIEQHAERLGLDAVALDSLERISDESKQRDRALHRQLRAAHDQMRSLLSVAEPDRAAVLSQSEKISALELAQQQNRLGAMLDIRGMLDAEQRALLVEISKERKSAGASDSRDSAPGREGPGPLPGCRGDIEEFCPEAGSGQPLLACLSGRYANLSPRCLDFLEHGPPPRRN